MAGKADKPEVPAAAAKSVAAGIFVEFCETITADKDLPGVGDRLKKALIENHDFSEASLRQALFGDAGP